MKILFVTRERTGRGAHIIFTTLIKGMIDLGNDVAVASFTMQGQLNDEPAIWKEIKDPVITIPFDPSKEIKEIKQIAFITDYLSKIAHEYDRIIITSWHIPCSAIQLGIFDNEKVWHLIQSIPDFTPENGYTDWKGVLFSLLPHFPSNKIAVSHAQAEVLRTRFRMNPKVLTLFVHDVFFDTTFTVKDRRVLKLISTCGDFSLPSKGLPFLLKQLSMFKAFPFELTLTSAKPYQVDAGEYPFPIVQKTLSDGHAVAGLMQEHDIFLNTSPLEGFSLALAEALAMGMPSIALDSIGNRDFMTGDNGILVRDHSHFFEELAKLKALGFRKQLSEKARESMKGYRKQDMLESFQKIINI